MGALRIVLTIVFIIVCIAITVLVLLQEGKQAGLGAIAGAAESYWGKNKGRSMEGTLVKVTKYLAIAFIVAFAATGATYTWMLIVGFILVPISIVYALIFRRCPNCRKYIPNKPTTLQCPRCGKSL